MCFAFETRESLRVAGYFLGQELQCNEAMKPGVLGLVDDAHATAAEFLYDAIVRNGLADLRMFISPAAPITLTAIR
jgi:hypothetical protein